MYLLKNNQVQQFVKCIVSNMSCSHWRICQGLSLMSADCIPDDIQDNDNDSDNDENGSNCTMIIWCQW